MSTPLHFWLRQFRLPVLAFRGATSATEVLVLAGLAYAIVQTITFSLYLYSAEIYPTRLRALGTGLGSAWLRLGSSAGPIIVGWLMAQRLAFNTSLEPSPRYSSSVPSSRRCSHGRNEGTSPRGVVALVLSHKRASGEYLVCRTLGFGRSMREASKLQVPNTTLKPRRQSCDDHSGAKASIVKLPAFSGTKATRCVWPASIGMVSTQ